MLKKQETTTWLKYPSKKYEKKNRKTLGKMERIINKNGRICEIEN